MKSLRFSNGAIKRLNRETGIDLMSGKPFAESVNGGGFESWVKVYWGGRIDAEPTLTLDEAETETDALEPGELVEGVNEAIRRAFRVNVEGPAAATPDEALEPKSE
jgi:hypothetical protein